MRLAHRIVRRSVLMGCPRAWTSGERAHRQIDTQAMRPRPSAPPRLFEPAVRVRVHYVDEWPVYVLRPKNGQHDAHVVYLHGGGYTAEISFWHWAFLVDLVRRTGATVSVPIYPLAPRATAATIVPRMCALAERLIASVGADRLVLMGDSAGGGMA